MRSNHAHLWGYREIPPEPYSLGNEGETNVNQMWGVALRSLVQMGNVKHT